VRYMFSTPIIMKSGVQILEKLDLLYISVHNHIQNEVNRVDSIKEAIFNPISKKTRIMGHVIYENLFISS